MKEHRGEIETSFTQDDYIARCSCGYQTGGYDTEQQASDALQAHLRSTNGEPETCRT